jgi:alpha-L-rhamnosidase
MYERIAGLAPDPAHPGYKHFFVRPLIPTQLEWASAKLETAYGTAESSWKRVDGKVVMDVVVPPNTTATIEFPNGRKSESVTAGSYRYELELRK